MKSKSVIEKTKLEFFKTFPIEQIMAELNFKFLELFGLERKNPENGVSVFHNFISSSCKLL